MKCLTLHSYISVRRTGLNRVTPEHLELRTLRKKLTILLFVVCVVLINYMRQELIQSKYLCPLERIVLHVWIKRPGMLISTDIPARSDTARVCHSSSG